jgi:hypothetical protein
VHLPLLRIGSCLGPLANRKDRPAIHRNVETVIQQLNDLGLVVEEWPAR